MWLYNVIANLMYNLEIIACSRKKLLSLLITILCKTLKIIYMFYLNILEQIKVWNEKKNKIKKWKCERKENKEIQVKKKQIKNKFHLHMKRKPHALKFYFLLLTIVEKKITVACLFLLFFVKKINNKIKCVCVLLQCVQW